MLADARSKIADQSNGADLRASGLARGPARVCYVIDRLYPAGTELQLLRLIAGLDRSRLEPYLCLLDGQDETSMSLEPTDCPVLRLGVRSLHRPSTLRKAWQFGRFLRRNRIDILQTHYADSTYFAVPIARLAGVRRIVLTRRNIGHWMRPIDRTLMRVCQHLSHATIANCQACRQAVIQQEGARPQRVHVIPNTIDLDRFLHIPPYQRKATGQPQRVGMVGNVRPVKGVDVLVRAAAIVAREFPNVTFHIAGGGDVEAYQMLARQCGVEDRVKFLGPVADIPDFLRTLDVAVLPSRAEGLSNALLEYMAAGRPIVATAVGGNVELIEEGVSGLLVPPDDQQVLASALHKLADSPGRSVELGENARRAVQRFANGAVYREYENVLARLIWARGQIHQT